jgi:hypothetical protein
MEATNGKMVIPIQKWSKWYYKNAGYVLLEDEDIVGYVALLINDEPEYEYWRNGWPTMILLFHRVAIAENH